MALASPNALWQVGRPRRRSSLSRAGRSSWISEYVCSISSAEPSSSTPSGNLPLIIRAASILRMGRKRLPPANTECRIARWITSGRCDSGGSKRSSAASVSTRPSSSVCYNMRKSEYSKRDSVERGQRASRDMYPTLMRRGKKVVDGAIPAEKLAASFPRLTLPIKPPFPPMEAKSVKEIPSGEGWLYEPKWDGFRCLAFRKRDKVVLQSKAGQPLGRYFPELVEAFRKLPAEEFVVDGEIIVEVGGHLSFDALLQRIHPAASRIKRLAAETPSSFLAFDLLVDGGGELLTKMPLRQRREE